MHKPGIPAQQMQRTGTHERVCRSGTGENPLAEHAHHDPQPCSIAWGGGGEAAMKGSAPCARESCWSRSQQELRCRYFFTGKEQVAQIAPDGPHPPRGTLPHACRTHGAKKSLPMWATPCGQRPTTSRADGRNGHFSKTLPSLGRQGQDSSERVGLAHSLCPPSRGCGADALGPM